MNLEKLKSKKFVMFLLLVVFTTSFVLLMITRSTVIRTYSLVIFLLDLVFIIIYFKNYLRGGEKKLEKRLKGISSPTKNHSLDKLKKEYEQIYVIYQKLPLGKKKKFSSSVKNVHHRIERKMKAGKKMEELIQKAGDGEIHDRLKNYEEIHEIYQKLPTSEQKRFYTDLVYAKEKLERLKE